MLLLYYLSFPGADGIIAIGIICSMGLGRQPFWAC